jgi:hypothetical protein
MTNGARCTIVSVRQGWSASNHRYIEAEKEEEINDAIAANTLVAGMTKWITTAKGTDL